jgi:hypothetical protein
MPADRALRGTMIAFRLGCIALVALGVGLAWWTHDADWVDRCGNLIVSLALVLTFVQFKYEVRHGSTEAFARKRAAAMLHERRASGMIGDGVIERAGDEARRQIEHGRAYILLNTLLAAAIGELISVFGGLVFRLVMPG